MPKSYKEFKKFKKEYDVECRNCQVRTGLRFDVKRQCYIYFCPLCGATVGAHFSNLAPMGFPANREIRILRRQAHIMLNNTAKKLKLSTKDSYRWLSEQLHINNEDCHFGMMPKDTLEKAINIMKTI